MKKFVPMILSGALAVSFSPLALAQTTYEDSNPSGNTRYNIHQRGDQNSTQFGTNNQSSQIEGDANQATQQGTQNQSAVGEGNQQSQQMGSGHSAEQDSTWSQRNAQNRQSGDSAAAGGSADDDEDRDRRARGKGKHENKGWHKGWDDPASSGSTRY